MNVLKDCLLYENGKENQNQATKLNENIFALKKRRIRYKLKKKPIIEEKTLLKNGRWSAEEQRTFLNTVFLYGSNWKKVKINLIF
jgi:hypothetical protein